MSKYDPRIDEYIAKAAPFAQPILSHLRGLIHTVCPDVEETWKWSFPNFDYKGTTMLSMAAFKQHCTFGFWKASLMPDPENIFNLAEKAAMGNLGKITSLADLPKDSVLKKYIKEAMKLNEAGVKRTLPKKATNVEKAALTTPPDFAALLKKNQDANTTFNNFSYSHKKEYIEWIEQAKTETTRNKRMAQAIEMIEAGKSRNWKYQK
ncbi:MAG: YdeI/OmpD-associated family protein [Taibaiella sp.]|nr:YdeI/OmpD-associated family protein [Taibaiella sp.]